MKQLSRVVDRLQTLGVTLKQGEPLSRHTSFQIGGPAAVMVFPASEEEMAGVLRICSAQGITPLILGAGTNVLPPDEGLDTVLVETRTGLTEIRELPEGEIEAQCGVSLARLAVFAMERGQRGLEFAHGIPGSVGGGVYMNAGAYGGELGQVVTGVTVMDMGGNLRDIPGGQLAFSYRHSRLMEEDWVILRVRVRLQKGEREEIRQRMTELMQKRRASQPLEYPSAGSTFKRPKEGYAAALIEEAGLKGLCVGGAQVSQKHAGFVINRNGATCAHVLALMEEVTKRVYAHSGVRLEPEIRVMEVKGKCDF